MLVTHYVIIQEVLNITSSSGELIIADKNFNILTNHKKSILLVGNFDGLHLGHQKLFDLALRYKKKYKLKIGVVTFEPMPKMYFNKSIKNFRISNLKQKNIMCL